MPSGQTHDRITLWSLPVVTGLTIALTRSSNLTLLVSGGFLFGGLMLSPDLDLLSRPFKRWGWLRWIWIPYQKTMRHRSILSHGPIVGTTLRVLYLGSWIVLLGMLGLVVVGDRYLVTVNFRLTPELRLTKLYQCPLRQFTA